MEVLDLLARLVDRSLVKVATAGAIEPRRYQLLEIIRQYALAKLPASSRVCFKRHAEFFLQVAEEVAPAIRSPSSASCVTRLNNEYNNIRAALRYCRDASDENSTGTRFVAVSGSTGYAEVCSARG